MYTADFYSSPMKDRYDDCDEEQNIQDKKDCDDDKDENTQIRKNWHNEVEITPNRKTVSTGTYVCAYSDCILKKNKISHEIIRILAFRVLKFK